MRVLTALEFHINGLGFFSDISVLREDLSIGNSICTLSFGNGSALCVRAERGSQRLFDEHDITCGGVPKPIRILYLVGFIHFFDEQFSHVIVTWHVK